jgi:hypothetical protein
MRRIFVLFILCFTFAALGLAQEPFGSVQGTVYDPQGAALPNATITVKNNATGATRTTVTNDNGEYRISQLQPGNYEVRATGANFKQSVAASVQVLVGQASPADFKLELGGATEQVTVTDTAEAQIDRTDNTVSGVVNTIQIENLPLNGRNFLDLAQLQPGTEKVDGASFDPTKANYTGVSIAGQAGRSTQITVDGGSVVDNVVGTTVQNFSQEIVQEFQIGLSNFSLASGASATGTVNIISRSGSNSFRGNAFGYFRDDSFAAFPSLNRLDAAHVPAAAQATRIPFDRQQFGGTIGGPIIKDKLFFFASYERNNQDGSSLRNPTFAPTFAGFSPNPFDETLFTGKIDWNINDRSHAYFRYSFDDNKQQGAFPSGSGIVPRDSTSNIFQSNDQIVTNRSHGFTAGWTYALTNSISNSLIFNFSDFRNGIDPAVAGVPEIRLSFDPDFRTGSSSVTPQKTNQKRVQVRDDLTWLKGAHTFSFGVNYEHTAINGLFTFASPARFRLFTPPSTETEADFLGAFVRDIAFGIGDPSLPFNNGGKDTINHRWQVYAGDNWRINPRLSLNYGIAYRWDSNLWNHDLGRPEIIAPLFDNGTAPAGRDTNNWAPRVGFAWDVAGDSKTVVRGGFGIYYDNAIDNLRLFERADLGPVGAEQFLSGTSVVSNLLPGGDGRFVDGQITLAQALALAPAVRADLESRLTNCTLPTALECTGTISGPIFASNFRVPYSLQYSIGVQRELPWNMLLQVDYNYRKGLDEIFIYDRNHSDSVAGPALADFSNSVLYVDNSAFSTYSGLLARLDRRFSNGFQFTASYALSRFKAFGADTLGLGAGPTDLNDFRKEFGPAGLDRTHRFVFSAIYDLPFYKKDSSFWKRNVLGNWTLSLISTAFSGVPQSLFLPDQVDLSGTGTFASYLPGTRAGSIGRDVKNVADVNALIRAYNANIAGGTDPFGNPLRTLAELPSDTQIGGDSVISQDFRVTKNINFTERYRLSFIGEVFNLFNIANLGNVSDFVIPAAEDISPTNPVTTLRPTQRTTGVFGTGGPRSFQFGVRFAF